MTLPADRDIDDLLATLSHELRTPLTSIKGALSLLLEETGTEVHREFLVIAYENAERLSRIINNFLDLSRIQAGQFELLREVVSLEEILLCASEQMRRSAEAKGITLTVERPADLPLLEVDRERIEQVLVNLVDNAIKFTPPGGQVTVRTSLSPLPSDGAPLEGNGRGAVKIHVVDTGIGIAREHWERIFDRFYQVDLRQAPPVPSGVGRRGAGLGLAICKALVEQHGGRVQVDSTPGQGSCFTILLPTRTAG